LAKDVELMGGGGIALGRTGFRKLVVHGVDETASNVSWQFDRLLHNHNMNESTLMTKTKPSRINERVRE
jgi:hypothetical protein